MIGRVVTSDCSVELATVNINEIMMIVNSLEWFISFMKLVISYDIYFNLISSIKHDNI